MYAHPVRAATTASRNRRLAPLACQARASTQSRDRVNHARSVHTASQERKRHACHANLATSLLQVVFQSALIVRPGSTPRREQTVASPVQRRFTLREGRTLALAAKAGRVRQARLVVLSVRPAHTLMPL